LSVEWLGEEWVRATTEALSERAPKADGASGLVAIDVAGKDGGSYWRRWEDGVPRAGGTGKPDEPPDLTLGLPVDDARAFWRGEWSPSVAYMRGQLRAAGDMTLLFALLAASARPEVADVLRSVDAEVSGG